MADNDRVNDPGQELKDRSLAEFAERTKGKPTPTQDENNRAALGEQVIEKENDGSNPDNTNLANPAGTTQRMSTGGNPAVNQSGAKMASPAPGASGPGASGATDKGYNTRQTVPGQNQPNKTE